jgi:diguanylate cyclase (GGDEF)-like protein/PAS domain S-box-containing protein
MRSERPEPVQAVLRKDGFGGIVACDDTITEVLGWRSADLVGKRSLDFIHAEDHDPTIALWMELLERPDSVQVVSYRHSHADGSWFYVEVTNRNLLESEGVVECSLVVLEKAEGESADGGYGASELKAIRFVRSGERLLRRLAEGLPTGVAYITSDGIVSYANSQCCLQLEVSSGAPLDELFGHLQEASSTMARDRARRIMGTQEEAILTVTNQLDGGSVRSLQIALRGLADDAEGPAGIVMTIDDVTDRIQATVELERRASTDPLTGCLNRSAMFEALQTAVADGEKLVVAFIDVDQMKIQNDMLGHAGGDDLLVATAKRLQGAVRPGDFVARIGGDEFVAVCLGVPTRNAASEVASRIADAVHWTFDFGPLSFPVSASVGAVYADQSTDPVEVIARADTAMYDAKRTASTTAVMWDAAQHGPMASVPDQILDKVDGSSTRSPRGHLATRCSPVTS